MHYYSCFDGENYYTVSSEVPLQSPCNGTLGAGAGSPTTSTTKDSIFPSMPGGFLPFGLGNIFPPFIADAIKDVLKLLFIAGAVLLLLYVLKRKK